MAFILRKLASPTFINRLRLLRYSPLRENVMCNLNINRHELRVHRRNFTEYSEHVVVLQSQEKSTCVNDRNPRDFSFDALFSTIEGEGFWLNLNNVISLLTTLANLTIEKHITPSSYIEDPRFKLFCEQLQKRIDKFDPGAVVVALRCLLTMGLDPESKTIQYFENEVLWKIKKMSFKSLSICLHILSREKKTDMQTRVTLALINTIKARWVEISDVDDVIKNLEKVSLFDEEFLSNVEERALAFVENMTLEELYKLCIALGYNNRRPVPLLQAIAYHFARHKDNLTDKQTIKMLNSLKSMNFSNQAILQKLSVDILPQIATMDEKSMLSLLTTFGQLRWRHPDILHGCCKWIISNLSSCRMQEIVSCILTLATLNYNPEENNLDNFFEAILPKLSRKLVDIDRVWLDVVLSLSILGKATDEHVASVLDPSFYGPLCATETFKDSTLVCKLKLLNVNAVAKVEIPLAKFSSELGHVFNNVQIPQSKLVQQGKDLVIASLSHFLPPGKFMATNLRTALGFLIDAEFVVDNYGKPVPIVEYGVRAGFDKDLKPLPSGCNRIALLVLNFKDFTLNTTSLVGRNVLAVRLLNKLGYKVVLIPFNNFKKHKTIVKQVQYLQQAINYKLEEPVSNQVQ